jgi:hypothetical protein
MGGHGPPPKPAAQRRRRNKPPEERVLAGTPAEVLPLPSSYRAQVREMDPETGKTVTVMRTLRYLAETREWYEAAVRSPLAVEWSDVDRWRFRDLARLMDAYYRGDLSVHGEIRLNLAAFGFTPADRRRLGVRMERPGERETAAPAATVRRLRAVDPAAG